MILCKGQMVPQCQCQDVEKCKAGIPANIMPCIDSCQQHASAIGANYQQLKQCILTQEPKN